MLKFCSLYSGSTGNSLFAQNNNTKILIDAGVSAKKIIEGLDSIDVSPNEIDAILITHEHSDHVQSVGTFSKKFDIPVYANSKTWSKIPKEVQKIDKKNIHTFNSSQDFVIGDLVIHPFRTPHDAIESCGFNISDGNTKISIATDLGHVTPEIKNCLMGSKLALLESNYEPEVLRICSYPTLLKSRIAGPNGHLSNNMAGQLISDLIESGLATVILGHLSKESNFPEMAYETVLSELESRKFKRGSIDLSVASRFEPSKLIEIS